MLRRPYSPARHRRLLVQLAGAPRPPAGDAPREHPPAADETQVDGYSARGFTVNGVGVPGPVLLLPDLCLRFRGVPTVGALTPDSLRAIGLLRAPVELLVVGYGGHGGRTTLPADAESWLLRRRISPELLSTPAACASFNFLVQERRAVGAILWPAGRK